MFDEKFKIKGLKTFFHCPFPFTRTREVNWYRPLPMVSIVPFSPMRLSRVSKVLSLMPFRCATSMASLRVNVMGREDRKISWGEALWPGTPAAGRYISTWQEWR